MAVLAKILLQEAPRAARARARRCRGARRRWSRACSPRIRRQRLRRRRAVDRGARRARPRSPSDRRRGRAKRRRRASRRSPERAAHRLVVIAGPSPTAERRWRGEHGAAVGASRRRPASGAAPAAAALRGRSGRAHGGARCTRCPTARSCVTLPDAGQGDRSGGAGGALRAGDARACFPTCRWWSSTGPRPRSRRWSVAGEVIDRGVRLLRGTPPGAIRARRRRRRACSTRASTSGATGPASFLRGERDVLEVKPHLLGKADALRRARPRDVDARRTCSRARRRVDGAARCSSSAPAGIGKSRLRAASSSTGSSASARARRGPVRARRLAGRGLAVRRCSAARSARAAGIHEASPSRCDARKLAARVGAPPRARGAARASRRSWARSRTPFPDDANDALRAARAEPAADGRRHARAPGKTGSRPSARRSRCCWCSRTCTGATAAPSASSTPRCATSATSR